jgi:hypothetical protein
MITRCSTFAFIRQLTCFNVSGVEMHFCERPREDPGNLEKVRELSRSKDVGVIAVGGIDHCNVVSMQTFRTAYRNSSGEPIGIHDLDQEAIRIAVTIHPCLNGHCVAGFWHEFSEDLEV